MDSKCGKDFFEKYLERYPDLPSVVLIRSVELKSFPKEFLHPPVLDLCCGDGFFAECLGLEGAYGCDIDPRATDQASARNGTYLKVYQSDARDLKVFRDGQFGTVLSNCALEHVIGVDQALMSVARVLRAGGRLIMSVPDENLNRWFFPKLILAAMGLPGYGKQLCDDYNRKQEHINIYPLECWRKKLEDSGMAVEKNFFLFRKKEYQLITFFESFVIDSFPGPFLRKAYSVLKNAMPVEFRRQMWRKLLKRIYLNAEPAGEGGELFIIATKLKMH